MKPYDILSLDFKCKLITLFISDQFRNPNICFELKSLNITRFVIVVTLYRLEILTVEMVNLKLKKRRKETNSIRLNIENGAYSLATNKDIYVPSQ